LKKIRDTGHDFQGFIAWKILDGNFSGHLDTLVNFFFTELIHVIYNVSNRHLFTLKNFWEGIGKVMMRKKDQAASDIPFDKNTIDNGVSGVFLEDVTDGLGQDGVERESGFLFPSKNIGHINLDIQADHQRMFSTTIHDVDDKGPLITWFDDLVHKIGPKQGG